MAAWSLDAKPLVVIVGETASGKTAAGIRLAKRVNGEVICADSRTIYKGMDIGTAKPTEEEQDGVPHHLLDVVAPDERFTVADFKRLAEQMIEDIASRGKVPIMVGGTGLYVDAVLFNYRFAPADAERSEHNPRHLKRPASIDRTIRPNTLIYGLSLEREVLESRVRTRIDKMIEDGLVDEVRHLGAQYGWDTPALQTPGYKAFRDYTDGTIGLDQAKALFIRNDLGLAKRQRTWFKRNKRIQWFDNIDKLVDIATTELNKIE